MTTTHFRLVAAVLGAAWLVAGCGSAGGPQYYSLADTAAPSRALVSAGGAPAYLELAPIAMPERFARPQLVVRKKNAPDSPAVDILEQHRWSSSFENELRDTLGSGIASRLGAVDAERVRVVEDVVVTVRRRVEVEEHVTGVDRPTAQFGVGRGRAREADHWRHVAQDLFGRGVDERQVGDELLLLTWKP